MAGEVQGWFDRLPQYWQERAQFIREMVLEAAPGMEEKWMFKSTPFYLHGGWMCFLSFKDDQLVLGFCAGARMPDPQGLFADTDHTTIRHFLPPKPPDRLNERGLRKLLDEAVRTQDDILAERAARKKHSGRKR